MIENAESHSHLTLSEQLEATRKAVEDLGNAVEHLAERERRGRLWTVVLAAVVVAVVLLSAFVWFDSRRSNRELRELGENLYLFSCSVSNDAREALREDNIADAEALILVTNADQTDPEAANQYREITRRNNETITPRDCTAELESITDY